MNDHLQEHADYHKKGWQIMNPMPTTDRLPIKPMNRKQEYHCEACKSWHLEPCAFGIPNNATWRDKPMQDEQKLPIILSEDTTELANTWLESFRKDGEPAHIVDYLIAQARHNERKAVIDEVLGTIQESLPLIKKELLAQLEKEE